MDKLSRIADSLNLKYKTCNFNTVFYAKSQAIGHFVEVDQANIKEAKKDMENQISFEDFLNKYSEAKVKRNVLITRIKYKNNKNIDVVRFDEFDLQSDFGNRIYAYDVSLYVKDFSDQWIIDYSKATSYSEESLTAFYFPTGFISPPIPQKYSNMIGYADCLIDTTTTKFKDIREEGSSYLPQNWTSLSVGEKLLLLEELRSTEVIGSCSQDKSPREHAVNIAMVSAETQRWDVFLKAHLDIMNDRFERNSDGNYAWGQRNTYIREIEELNINVTDLLLGIIFRIKNPATNHYYGSIGRIGRALSETQNRKEVEQAMLSIIADQDLDLYNRLLFYFLYQNYSHYITDEAVKSEIAARLALVTKTLPEFVKESLTGN